MSRYERGQAAKDAVRFTGQVFLTGVTGYLGAHLLLDLLEHTDARLSCLVRGADEAAARQSLLRQLAWYFPEFSLDAHGDRVEIVRGDMEAPDLGIIPTEFERLAAEVDVILNSAADVNHVGAASRSFRINAEAVETLLGFAKKGKAKAFHQVSTVSVRGEFRGQTPISAFKETHLEEGQSFAGAYQESKHRAEVMLRKAFAEGQPGGVYRVGYIGPHSVTGRYQRNIQQSNTARYVRACVRLGLAPYTPDDTVQLTPVDSVARAITLLMTRTKQDGQTYYVESPQQIRQYDVLRVLHAVGYSVRLMSEAEFLEKAPRLSQDAESLSAISPTPELDDVRAICTDDSWSQRELRKLGFEYPRLTSDWLGRFLGHAIEVGFIEAPRFWNTAALLADLL